MDVLALTMRKVSMYTSTRNTQHHLRDGMILPKEAKNSRLSGIIIAKRATTATVI
jgi:hypothetical protein